MNKPLWTGSWVALVTPMDASGAIDTNAFVQLLEWHVESGSAGIVLLGTTAETPTLLQDEKDQLLHLAIDTLQGRLPIIVGIGSNDTRSTCKQALWARDAGANGLLVVTPYYNKPPQRGLIAHYKAVSEATDLPIMLYDVPSRTGISFEMPTLEVLYKIPSIRGIKDASGDLGRVEDLCRLMPEWSIMTGNDDQVASFLALGGHGVVSVAANVVPDRMVNLCAGDSDEGRALEALNEVLFCDTNPIPVKWALHAMGRIPAGIRLPLVPLGKVEQSLVEDVLRDMKEL